MEFFGYGCLLQANNLTIVMNKRRHHPISRQKDSLELALFICPTSSLSEYLMPELIGASLGPYRILEQIGRGGMATVFKSYHPATNRYVAIKILPEEIADDPNFRERFEREAKVVASLNHVHIVPVFDYGQDRNIAYLVMPFIQTGTLKEYLDQGSLSLEEAYRLFMQIASAVHYAHRKGILHRDIKPANILLDDSKNALLSDFGLTRMIESASSVTGKGVVGTPDYMSPEQGQGQPIDTRSDIYSLGVVLYELLTGEVPFSADTPVAVIYKHANAPLPLPRTKRPDLPQGIENVILKSLAKEPDDRFQTVEEMALALRATIRAPSNANDGPSTVLAPPSLDTEVLPERKRFSLQSNAFWTISFIITLLCGVMMVALWVMSSSIVQENDDARPAFRTEYDSANTHYAEVLVAIQDLPRGIHLNETMVAVKLLPADVVPPYSYRADQKERVMGMVARVDIARGSLLLQHQLYWDTRWQGPTPVPANNLYMYPSLNATEQIEIPFSQQEQMVAAPSDKVEFTINITRQIKFPDGLAPGDRVDIWATRSDGDIFNTDIELIAWLATIGNRSASQLTVIMSINESLTLSDSIVNGDLVTLVIRPLFIESANTIPDVIVSRDTILDQLGIPTPQGGD
jgi:serine/threonine protein kinase